MTTTLYFGDQFMCKKVQIHSSNESIDHSTNQPINQIARNRYMLVPRYHAACQSSTPACYFVLISYKYVCINAWERARGKISIWHVKESLKTRRASSGNSISQQQQQQQQAFSSRGGVGRDGDSNTSNSNLNKRYLILTYAGEYDRVHYPLPLAFVENDHGRERLSEEEDEEEDGEDPRTMSRSREVWEAF